MIDHAVDVGDSCSPSALPLLERWMKKRYGITMLLALASWPAIAKLPQLESLVANGMLLDSYYQLGYLTITNVVAFFFAISVLRVLESRNPGGIILKRIAGNGEAPWGWYRIFAVGAAATIAPLIVAIAFASEFETTDTAHFLLATLTIALSAATAGALLWVIGCVKSNLFGSHEDSANYFPFEARTATGFRPLVDLQRKLEKVLLLLRLGKTDLQFLAYLLFLATVHFLVARGLESSDYWLTSAPSMLVLYLWLVFMVLAGLANWLDRWRIPVLPTLVLVLSVVFFVRGSTRPLKMLPDRSSNRFISKIAEVHDLELGLIKGREPLAIRRERMAVAMQDLENTAWSAIDKRMLNIQEVQHAKGKTLVMVTCPGGGIHAAAWAACVLDQLCNEYVEFKDSLCLISGVSGGSVGALLFVGSRYEHQLLGNPGAEAQVTAGLDVARLLKSRSPALELAACSSLEAIAFGATVDDLYDLISIPGAGRGQRLEDSWNSRLPNSLQSLTMGEWGDRAVAGDVPIVAFNSTDAVTGRRVVFDTIPTPSRLSSFGLTARPFNYRELLKAGKTSYDLLPATAARTSATFPYVSPFTKPGQASRIGECVALCDGGYVDNEGIVTAVNWIEFLLKRWAAQAPMERTFDRILLLRIEPASVEDKHQPPDAGGPYGWFRWLTGPAETIFKVRSTSQLERGNLESDLAALFLTFRAKRANEPSMDEPSSSTTLASTITMPQSSIVEIAEFDKDRYSPAQIRENWDKMLEDYQQRGAKSDSIPRQDSTTTAISAEEEKAGNQRPVIVQSITFVDANQVIPLNWKLSNRQKLGYLLAWELCSAENSPLRQTLDRYFNRK
jgi:hypothetical protein